MLIIVDCRVKELHLHDDPVYGKVTLLSSYLCLALIREIWTSRTHLPNRIENSTVHAGILICAPSQLVHGVQRDECDVILRSGDSKCARSTPSRCQTPSTVRSRENDGLRILE